MELKEILFNKVNDERNDYYEMYNKACTYEDKETQWACYHAIYGVIREAGLEDEYHDWIKELEKKNFERPSTLKATNIDWDVESAKERRFLPTEIEIPDEVIQDETLETYDDLIDAVSDYISDKAGFCHFGFRLEEHYKKDSA
ncbi:MAG: hypothetical protein LUC25_01085 [Ruminococcus sp.]|nr:hypothetical protein [Ruminococcus sp.]